MIQGPWAAQSNDAASPTISIRALLKVLVPSSYTRPTSSGRSQNSASGLLGWAVGFLLLPKASQLGGRPWS